MADVSPSLLPPSETVPGWPRQQVRIFTPKNLWEYIDGGADLFLAYGFTGLVTGQYAKDIASDRSLVLDIYDMATPLNAYGIYTNEKGSDGKSLSLGAEGYIEGELIAFWKGAYYVKLAALNPADVQAATRLAAAAATYLQGTTELPEDFRTLPEKDRIAGSERYVRKDALGHKELMDVISAGYRMSTGTATLYLSRQADAHTAAQAWQKLRAFEKARGRSLFDLTGLGDSAFSVQDSGLGEMVAARKAGAVAIAASEKSRRQELADLVRRLPGWVRPKAAS